MPVCADELVISKQYPSAFFGTSLASTLTTLGIDTLIHTGVSTSGCVRATCWCRQLLLRFHSRSSCATRSATATPRRTRPICSTWDAKYGDVVSEAEVTAYLEKSGAKHDAKAQPQSRSRCR